MRLLRSKYDRPKRALYNIETPFPQLPRCLLLRPVLMYANRQLGDALTPTRWQGEFEGTVSKHIQPLTCDVLKTPAPEVVYFASQLFRIFFLAG